MLLAAIVVGLPSLVPCIVAVICAERQDIHSVMRALVRVSVRRFQYLAQMRPKSVMRQVSGWPLVRATCEVAA
jgi:hypothetical protein